MESYLRIRHPGFTVDQRMEFIECISRLDGQWFKTTEDLKPDTESQGSNQEE